MEFHELFEALDEAVFIHDATTGDVVAANRAVANLYGYPPNSFLGGGVSHGSVNRAPYTREAALEHFTLAATGQEQRFDWRIHHADGHEIPVEVTLKRVHTSAGVRVLSLVHDARERQAREQLQEALIRSQETLLAELSTPLIPINDRVLVLPLIGTVDQRRAQQIIEAVLAGVTTHRATTAIIDITGVPVVDTHVAQSLVQTARAVRLLGATTILTGIRPETAQTIINLGADLDQIITRARLQDGIAYALRGDQGPRTKD